MLHVSWKATTCVHSDRLRTTKKLHRQIKWFYLSMCSKHCSNLEEWLVLILWNKTLKSRLWEFSLELLLDVLISYDLNGYPAPGAFIINVKKYRRLLYLTLHRRSLTWTFTTDMLHPLCVTWRWVLILCLVGYILISLIGKKFTTFPDLTSFMKHLKEKWIAFYCLEFQILLINKVFNLICRFNRYRRSFVRDIIIIGIIWRYNLVIR